MSLLKIITNLDCNVYVDTEFKGEALPGTIYKIEMRKGKYILDFISLDSAYDKIQMDYYMEDSDMEDLIRIDLLSIQQARIEEENKIKELFAERIKQYMQYRFSEQGYPLIFSEGVAAVCLRKHRIVNTKEVFDGYVWGYINERGEEVIPLQYDDAQPFSEGLAGVRKDNYLCGFIDVKGNLVISCKYKTVGNFSNGLAWFESGNWSFEENTNYGYINKKGDIVIPAIYDVVNDFKNDRAIVGVYRREKLLYGLIDTLGKEIIPCICSYIEFLPNSEFKVCWYNSLSNITYEIQMDKDGFCWINNKSEKYLFTLRKYSPTGIFVNGLMEVVSTQNDKWGIYSRTEPISMNNILIDKRYVNNKGEMLVKNGDDDFFLPEKYDWGSDFHEGLAKVAIIKANRKEFVVGGRYKYGFINEQGNEAIPCRYDDISDFSNGIAIINKNHWINNRGEYSVLNNKKRVWLPNKYERGDDFNYGISIVTHNGRIGVINESFYEIIPCCYDYISIMNNEILLINNNGKYGLYSIHGILLIPIEYDYIQDFSEGLAVVLRENKYGYVNIDGKIVISLEYDHATNFSEGLAAVKDSLGYWGYIDIKGETRIPCKYKNASSFNEGLASVQDKNTGLMGYVNIKGEIVIPCQYSWRGNKAFVNGQSIVFKDKQKFKIDKEGNILI